MLSPNIFNLPRRLSESLARWRLARWQRIVRQIRSWESSLGGLTNTDLLERSVALRRRAFGSGKPLEHLLSEAFALVSECAARQLGMRPYPVQLLGGIALHRGLIVEMQTGEGKTLTAALPVFLNALANQGVHVATANDYLAARDAEWLRPVYKSLGMTVGSIQAQMPPAPRSQAYRCDITYGTAKEFGFDFLRDRLAKRRSGLWEGGCSTSWRQAHFAVVDEADCILIDEVQSPLIISDSQNANDAATVAKFQWCAEVCPQFREVTHFDYDAERKSVALTAAGEELLNRLSKPDRLQATPPADLRKSIEQAIKGRRDFLRDRHYVVRDGKVVIVDEFTGRLGEGRQWRDGLHQAVEAQERLPITPVSSHSAQITLQEFMARYPRLSGMTGTAFSSRREFRKVYGLRVVRMPPHRPCRRMQLPDRILATDEEKWNAVVAEVREMQQAGRPVLVGTRSIDRSELLSRMLTKAGVAHEVLNAKYNAEEARIIAAAGQSGKVTVATNMAGRGTDIRLGDGVAELGGLHVVSTELHDAQRIDRQLAGRCARQGDPGSTRQFLSLTDEILATGFAANVHGKIDRQARRDAGSLDGFKSLFRDAQRRVERRCFQTREMMMRHARQRTEQLTRIGLDPYLDFGLF